MGHNPISNTAPVNFAGTANSGNSSLMSRYDHIHTLTATAPLTWDVINGIVKMPLAATSSNGWVSFSNWTLFNQTKLNNTSIKLYKFLSGVTNTPFIAATNGSSAAVANISGSTPTLGLTSGTSSSGRAGILTYASLFYLGGTETELEINLQVPVLSTTTQAYTLRLGYINSLTADSTNGAYFEYQQSTSIYWRYCTANSSTRTKNNSSIAVTAGAWIKLRILVNSAGNLATFYIDDVSVGTINLNIPVTAGNETGIGIALNSSAGFNRKNIYIEYVKYRFG